MARAINRLTDRKAQSLKEPGRHPDGGGLYLRITSKGAKSWIFMSAAGSGKRTEIGLGAFTSVKLAEARRKAEAMREAVAKSADPRAALLQPEEAPEEVGGIPTFGDCADTYIANQESGWKSEVHRKQWHQSLKDHAAPLRAMSVDAITTEDVLGVLRPLWLTKNETARRLRGRIERILGAAKAAGSRPVDSQNPAAWDGHLEHFLPKRSKLSKGHHKAVPWKDMPAFWAELNRRPALAARCLEFTILTAARSGEALLASWGEIDVKNALWVVPAERMKAGVEHIVPLSATAIRILDFLRPDAPKPTDRIFAIDGAVRSNMAMAMLMRRMKRDETVHGFRSSFRDFSGESTDFPRELAEMALAHTVGGVEGAYRRGRAVEKRRPLMEDWAAYLEGNGKPVSG